MPFHLVDRITFFDPGRAVRGIFAVPAGVAELPGFLLAEAVGQLASWAVMAQLEFTMRPVAALAGEIVFLGDATAGDTLHLNVALDRIEHGGIVYGGSASVGERQLLRINRCVGPLLTMEDFDDPEAARARFALLRDNGLPPHSIDTGPPLRFEVLEEEPGKRLRVALQVPLEAPFFAEHFPRRPVYPATMLLNEKSRVARRLLRAAGSDWRLCRAMHAKIGVFTLPGEQLEIEAVRLGGSGDEAVVQVTGFRDGVRVSRVRLEFTRHPA